MRGCCSDLKRPFDRFLTSYVAEIGIFLQSALRSTRLLLIRRDLIFTIEICGDFSEMPYRKDRNIVDGGSLLRILCGQDDFPTP